MLPVVYAEEEEPDEPDKVLGEEEEKVVENNNKDSEEKKEKNKVSKKYPESIRQWGKYITKAAKKFDLDPDLIAAIIMKESGGNPDALGAAGECGMMQIIAGDKNYRFAGRPTCEQLLDPKFNIFYGAEFLKAKIDKYGFEQGIRCYNGCNAAWSYYVGPVLQIYETYKKQ